MNKWYSDRSIMDDRDTKVNLLHQVTRLETRLSAALTMLKEQEKYIARIEKLNDKLIGVRDEGL
jgi:hypothetical protein